jgi:hypothetical protein
MNYPPYPVRSFTYRNEQVRADEVNSMIVYNTHCLLVPVRALCNSLQTSTSQILNVNGNDKQITCHHLLVYFYILYSTLL